MAKGDPLPGEADEILRSKQQVKDILIRILALYAEEDASLRVGSEDWELLLHKARALPTVK